MQSYAYINIPCITREAYLRVASAAIRDVVEYGFGTMVVFKQPRGGVLAPPYTEVWVDLQNSPHSTGLTKVIRREWYTNLSKEQVYELIRKAEQSLKFSEELTTLLE